MAGAQLVGPLPAELGSVTVFSAAIGAGAHAPDAAKSLIQFLTGLSQPSTLEGMRSAGQAYEASRVVYRVGLFILFGGVITAVVGYVFCLFAPNKYASLGLTIATLATWLDFSHPDLDWRAGRPRIAALQTELEARDSFKQTTPR